MAVKNNWITRSPLSQRIKEGIVTAKKVSPLSHGHSFRASQRGWILSTSSTSDLTLEFRPKLPALMESSNLPETSSNGVVAVEEATTSQIWRSLRSWNLGQIRGLMASPSAITLEMRFELADNLIQGYGGRQ
ncbi:hypothetical protein CRG98_043015 [Punica granatum]|uniref:Uncharacterized protein n=1 Tax=Punica granatum TaxID=22663 RepID=A0A2I0HY23_PUNGR|nr:hypothetical protein CRG98_043015 [Punica granatum]